jgi:hypothetical protein
MRRFLQRSCASTSLTIASVISASVAHLSTETFAANVTSLQKELSKSDKKRDLMQEGKKIFETESLEDALTGGLNPTLATAVAGAATAMRITPAKSPSYQQLVSWILQPEVVNTLDGNSIGRILHAELVLADPRLFEVLFTYLWRVVELAPTFNGIACAMILNAYGRSGIHHDRLYEVICERARTALKEESITIAHVANVANALSRVQVCDAALFGVLRDLAIKFQKQAPPLVMTTILDAFSTVGIVDPDLFTLYEAALAEQIVQCSAPLMTSILNSLVKAKRTKSVLFSQCAVRAVSIASTYDASSIAKSLDAFYQAENCSEEFFGAMAERACKVAADFRADEIHLTLRALSHFELFDAELFPLLASRLVSIAKVNKSIPPEDVIGIVSSFAAVRERHDELIHTCSLLMRPYLEAIRPELFTELLWAFGELNLRSETTRSMVTLVRSKQVSLAAPTGNTAKDEVLQKRLAVVKQVYGLE